MKNESIKILQQNKKTILDLWMKNQAVEEGFRDYLLNNENQLEQSDELLTVLLNSLNDENFENIRSKEFDKIIDVLAGISVSRAKQGFSPRETGEYIFGLKDALLQVAQQEIKDLTVLYQTILNISKLFDHLGIVTFETFIKGREDVIFRQTEEITEISTPVIRVWDGILALPIIGTLDSSRTQVVMENLLQEIVETGSQIAILDISGVPAVDSLVAQHLIKTVTATRLMGAECIISGIRPEIAQTVVHLGIDLSNIITKSTLASALKTAFTMLTLEVVKKSRIK
ncbi:STAS domain-containing protein [Runella sp.]|uniref:STAS domain-containing protein n=1 Tax=Runella sp. TaxID=1960881 RepID=UPI003D11B4AB